MSADEAAFLRALHPLIWLAWLLYWFVSARNVKQTVRRESPRQRLSHALPFVLAALLLGSPHLFPRLDFRVVPPGLTAYWIGTGLLIAGLAFSIWARVTLGRNWSGTVTVKEDHELIQGGPYRYVRHPIYTGLIGGFLGSALAQGLCTSFIAFALIVVSLWLKLLREEAFMRQTFGERYEAYGARTKRLVPFLW